MMLCEIYMYLRSSKLLELCTVFERTTLYVGMSFTFSSGVSGLELGFRSVYCTKETRREPFCISDKSVTCTP